MTRNTIFLGHDFENLLESIENGASPSSDALLPFLCAPKLLDRIEANYQLALAYYNHRNFQTAKDFIERAFFLSEYSQAIIPLFEKIQLALGNIDAVKHAFKRAGMVAAYQNKIEDAVSLLNCWQYSHMTYSNQDQYEYDWDVEKALRTIADSLRPPAPTRQAANSNPKIRLGYLVKDITVKGSNLIRINHALTSAHNKNQFDVHIFCLETDREIFYSEAATAEIERFLQTQCTVHSVPHEEASSLANRLTAAANIIQNNNIDILITSALMADLTHYILAAMKPAKKIVSLLQGPPEQFTSSIVDWTISWSPHPAIEAPTDCSLIDLKMNFDIDKPQKPYQREDYNLKTEDCVLFCAGRTPKFQDCEYWQTMKMLLEDNQEAVYMIAGATIDQVPEIVKTFPQEVLARIHFLGWRKDIKSLLTLADIVLDTYPSGGGLILLEAMAQGLPVIAHKNNYMRPFSQIDWSPAEDIVDIPYLLIERGDQKQFLERASELIRNRNLAKQYGERCRNTVSTYSPIPGVKKCEQILQQLYNSD